jgi:hypothetical protein
MAIFYCPLTHFINQLIMASSILGVHQLHMNKLIRQLLVRRLSQIHGVREYRSPFIIGLIPLPKVPIDRPNEKNGQAQNLPEIKTSGFKICHDFPLLKANGFKLAAGASTVFGCRKAFQA